MHDTWTSFPALLAQEQSPQGTITELPGMPGQDGSTAAPGGPGQGAQQGSPGGLNMFTFLLPLLLVFMVFTLFSGSRKQKAEQKKRQQMLDALTRNDRVQTIGGIIGSVVEVRNDEVVLKVDDATNTRIHFSRSSIQQVLRDAPGKVSASATAEVKPNGAAVEVS